MLKNYFFVLREKSQITLKLREKLTKKRQRKLHSVTFG